MLVRQFEERDNQKIWRFLNEISSYSALYGFLQTKYKEDNSYSAFAKTNGGHNLILLVEREDNKEIIGIANFSIKNQSDNQRNCFVFGLKIHPDYQELGLQKKIFDEISEIQKKQNLKISQFYCYIKSYENTSQNIYSSLGFSFKRRFYCLVESIQVLKKIQKLNEKTFSLKKGMDFQENEKYQKYVKEISKNEQYVETLTTRVLEDNKFLGINLWVQSLQFQAHVTKFLLPVEYFFSKNTMPIFITIIIVFLLAIFTFLRENTFLFSLFIGLYIGIVYAFLKLRSLLFSKRKPILCLFSPISNVEDEHLKEKLLENILAEVYKDYHKDFSYFKLILPEEPIYGDFITKILSPQGIIYQFARFESNVSTNSEKIMEGESENEYIDPTDIS